MPQIRSSKGMNRFEVEHVLPLSTMTTKGLFRRSFNMFRGVAFISEWFYLSRIIQFHSRRWYKVYHKLVGWCR